MNKHRLTICLSLILLLISACEQTTPTPDLLDVPQFRLLATVYVSPTPDEEQLQATRFAVAPTNTPIPPTPIPSPTAYVGVFLGEVQRGGPSGFTTPLYNVPDAQPTADPTRCETAVDEAYLGAWSQNETVNGLMGCPIQIAFGFEGQVQIFERGVMYQRDETDEVWAIVPGGTGIGHYWYVERPPELTTDEYTAPAGLRVPDGDFGGVWKGIMGVRDALGFAQTSTQQIDLGIQRFQGGTFFLDQTVGQSFALIVNGDAYGPY